MLLKVATFLIFPTSTMVFFNSIKGSEVTFWMNCAFPFKYSQLISSRLPRQLKSRVFTLEWNTKFLFRLNEHRKTQMILRSSHRKCSLKQGALKNFTNFILKHLRLSLFLDKVSGLPILKNMRTAASGFHDFILLVKFVHKTNFSDSIFYFNSSSLVFFIFQMWIQRPGCFQVYAVYEKSSQSSITDLPISSNHL